MFHLQITVHLFLLYDMIQPDVPLCDFPIYHFFYIIVDVCLSYTIKLTMLEFVYICNHVHENGSIR